MIIHKRARLTPLRRKELVDDYWKQHVRVCDLKRKYGVSAPTVYKIIHRGRLRDYSIHTSTNKRFRCLEYGIKRLSKIEKEIEERLKKQAKRYNKQYPGEMVHMDTKRLPILERETPRDTHEYLFAGIDDFSRELYAAILPDRTQYSATTFLKQVLDECPFQYLISGTLHVVMADGTETDLKPGCVSLLPSGHDAWVVGNEPVVGVDFQGMVDYAKEA